MCVVCETRKKQIELIMDVEKREISILVQKTDEAARLAEEINRRLAKMLALQDELPDAFSGMDVLMCPVQTQWQEKGGYPCQDPLVIGTCRTASRS